MRTNYTPRQEKYLETSLTILTSPNFYFSVNGNYMSEEGTLMTDDFIKAYVLELDAFYGNEMSKDELIEFEKTIKTNVKKCFDDNGKASHSLSETRWTAPARIECCDEWFELYSGSHNFCEKCGSHYNTSGQLLAHPSLWGDDEGEHNTDVRNGF